VITSFNSFIIYCLKLTLQKSDLKVYEITTDWSLSVQGNFKLEKALAKVLINNSVKLICMNYFSTNSMLTLI